MNKQFRVKNKSNIHNLNQLMRENYEENFVGSFTQQTIPPTFVGLYDINGVAVFSRMDCNGENERILMIGEDYKIEITKYDIELRTRIRMEAQRTRTVETIAAALNS